MTLILSGTDGLSDVDGSAATPAIRGSDTNTGMFFPAADTIAFSEGGVESMRLDSNGNVGIGTSSPAAKLQVASGNLRLTDGFQLEFGGSRNSISGAEASNYLLFYTNNLERARINASGQLLVNTTSNSLHGGRININYTNGVSAGMEIKDTLTSGTGVAVHIVNGIGNVVGSITQNQSNTTYATSSDYRLKENVQPLTGALARVTALKPVTWSWKLNGTSGEGFIAHELQTVVPDAVVGEKDAVDESGKPVYQGVDTSFLVATLTAAIQEQQAMIVELKAEVDALKAQLGAQA